MLRKFYNPLSTHGGIHFGLISIERAIEDFDINLNPDYQRDHVWTNEQGSLFVGHIIEGGHVGQIICNEHNDYKFGCDVVDGKQRLTAIRKWNAGEIPAKLSTGQEIWINDLDKQDRTLCHTAINFRLEFVRLNREQVLRLYLKLNRGGTVHSETELKKVESLIAEETTTKETNESKQRTTTN